jgi:hypothetical protein
LAFTAGKKLTAQLLNQAFPAAVSNRQDTDGNTTSTTYTATLSAGSAAGVAFTAPSSGSVLVLFGTASYQSGTANDNKSAPQVRTGTTVGSGTIVYAASDSDMLLQRLTGSGEAARGTSFAIVTGLTAGSTYNAQLLHKVSAGTGNFLFKFITVIPLTS